MPTKTKKRKSGFTEAERIEWYRLGDKIDAGLVNWSETKRNWKRFRELYEKAHGKPFEHKTLAEYQRSQNPVHIEKVKTPSGMMHAVFNEAGDFVTEPSTYAQCLTWCKRNSCMPVRSYKTMKPVKGWNA